MKPKKPAHHWNKKENMIKRKISKVDSLGCERERERESIYF